MQPPWWLLASCMVSFRVPVSSASLFLLPRNSWPLGLSLAFVTLASFARNPEEVGYVIERHLNKALILTSTEGPEQGLLWLWVAWVYLDPPQRKEPSSQAVSCGYDLLRSLEYVTCSVTVRCLLSPSLDPHGRVWVCFHHNEDAFREEKGNPSCLNPFGARLYV